MLTVDLAGQGRGQACGDLRQEPEQTAALSLAAAAARPRAGAGADEVRVVPVGRCSGMAALSEFAERGRDALYGHGARPRSPSRQQQDASRPRSGPLLVLKRLIRLRASESADGSRGHGAERRIIPLPGCAS